MMDDKSLLDLTKPPVDTSPTTSVNRNVTKCCMSRELGFKQKTNVVPNELQWAAEDKMVMRTHDEHRCELPDVSRSTFLMVFSPDGKKVASTHGNHNVYVTDLTSGKNIKTLTGHPRTPWCIAFHPSSNQILASGCLGGQVRVWDLHGGSEIWTAESQTVIASLAFHPIDRMLVIASYNELHFWDWSQPEPFAKCFTSNEKEKVRYVAFDQLGHKLITGVANAPSRCTSQWDRVSAPQPPPQTSQLDSERRITICYRYMVEQYEQLVQRYYDLSRARSTPTIDRGTDPMDLDSESTSHSSDSSRSNITSSSQSVLPTVNNRSNAGTATTTTTTTTAGILDTSEVVPTTSLNETTTSSSTSSLSSQVQFGNVFLTPWPQSGDCTQTTPCHTHTFSTPLPQPSLLTGRVAAGTDERSASRSSTQFLTDNVGTPAVTPTASARMTGVNSTDSNENPNWMNTPVILRRAVHTSPGTANILPPTPSTVSSGNCPDSSNAADNHCRPCGNTRTGGSSQNYYSHFLFRNCSQSQPDLQPTTATSTRCSFSVQNRNRSESETSPVQSSNKNSQQQSLEAGTGLTRRHSIHQNNNSSAVNSNSNDNRRPGSPLDSSQNINSISDGRSRLTTGTGSSRRIDSVEPTPRRSVESTSTAVSRLRTQFRRLQSAYHSRSTTHASHVLSAESQAAERRLLNRLNEILERPLPDPRARRTFSSRRSAFQPRNTTSSSAMHTGSGLTRSSVSPDIGGVRYGIQLLSRHIDNMQRLCRARYSYVVEILQFQQIRRMWEDLQSQIYALHGAVRDGNGEGGGGGVTNSRNDVLTSTTSGSASGGSVSDGGNNTDVRNSGRNRNDSRSESESGDTQERTANNMLDLLTDDDSDGPSSSGNVLLRPAPGHSRRTVPPCFRRYKMLLQRNPRLVLKRPRTSAGVNRMGESSRRLSYLQTPITWRRNPAARTTSSGQATTSEDQISERGEASSSHVSGETSTGTSERERDRRSVRGVKRKSKDSEQLFRPRPTPSNPTGAGTSGSSSQQPYNLAMSMRETIMQLESMVWRHRERNAQRNMRMSRFTRQREERMMRNLWDTESSHESSRDDQSEGDSSQQGTGVAQEPSDTEWSRESTRLRARQVLLLMVDSLTQFFENDSLSRRTSNEALLDRIHNLYVLLQLALNLTDLLLAQLVSSRREIETRRPSSLPTYLGASSNVSGIDTNDPWTSRYSSRSRHIVRNLGRPESWRRTLRFAAPNDTSQSTPTNNSDPGDSSNRRNSATPNTNTGGGSSRGLPPRHHSVYSNIRNAMLSHHRMTVPVVRVNDLPAPSLESSPPPRPRPHSPPPFPIGGGFASRFLYPRYPGPNPFDESTSEDSSPQDRSDNFFFMRGYGPGSVILSDTPVSPHHRIQAWDFSNYIIPDISNAEKNIVVSECKIHNDASVDMSVDGRLLVTLLPSGRLSSTTMLGIYSLQWETLGQLLYTTSFEQNAVSVSLSPTTRHLVVGLASRRAGLVNTDRHTNAQIFRLEGASPGRKSPLGPRGRLVYLRDLELNRHLSFMSLNCIRWAPNPGQGLVYGTNTGHLKILR